MIANKHEYAEFDNCTKIVRTYPDAARKAQAARRHLAAFGSLAIKKKQNRDILRSYGFEGPVAYVILGAPDTTLLKKHGAKFPAELLHWICPVKPVWFTPMQYVPVKAKDLFECNERYEVCLKTSAYHTVCHLDPMVGRYSARVGEKVTHKAYVVEVAEYRSKPLYGLSNKPFSTYKYTMKTAGGHTLVWHTTCARLKDGGAYVLTGTVKEHFDHYNVRCTMLSNCKVLKEGMWNDHE